MPYETTDELPANVKKKYSDKALRAFMAAFNGVMKQTNDESRAFAAAHSAAMKVDGLNESVTSESATFKEAEWTSAFINDLPDGSFAYIESGGEKDEGGKTAPRSLRHFPYKDSAGKVDLPHLRNALARAPQSPHGDKAMPKLRAAAKAAGIGEYAESANFWVDSIFTEAPQYDEEKKVHKWPVRVIKPGWSLNNMFYTSNVLSHVPQLLEGKKAYINHETKSEIKDRGSRSIGDVAGWYSDLYQDTDGSVNGNLNLVETPLTEHAIKLGKANPSLIGLSINAKGRASRGEVDGKKGMIAEAIEEFFSTDIVTEPAAGGEVKMVASVTMDHDNNENDDIKESDTVTDDEKVQASWLLGEMNYKFDVAAYLAAVNMGKLSDVEKTNRKNVIESKMEKIPENWRGYLKNVLEASDDIDAEYDKFMEVLKADPAVKLNDTTGAVENKDVPGPGQEGYKPHFM